MCSLGGLQQQQQVRKLEDAERHLRRLRPRPCAEPAPAPRPQTAEEQQGKAEPCPAARPRRASCTLRALRPCAARPPGCCWVHDAVAFGPTTQMEHLAMDPKPDFVVCVLFCVAASTCATHTRMISATMMGQKRLSFSGLMRTWEHAHHDVGAGRVSLARHLETPRSGGRCLHGEMSCKRSESKRRQWGTPCGAEAVAFSFFLCCWRWPNLFYGGS